MQTESFPAGYLEQLSALSGMDVPRYLQSMDAPRVRALRLGTCKMPYDMAKKAAPCVESIPWEAGAYVAAEDFHGSDIAHRIGAYYMQEPSAMLPVAALSWDKSWRVLDLCASPGGKTHQLACRLSDGFLVSNEISPSRARTLLSNVERMGISRAAVTNAAPKTLADGLGAVFDAVLCDAPCSGEGLFRRDPEAMNEWSPERSLGCAQRQLEILEQADRLLKVGGYLVYSTCTFAKAENEDVVAAFLKTHDYEIREASAAVQEHTLPGESGMTQARRYYPYLGCGEGQFLCVLQKCGGTGETARIRRSAAIEPPRDALAEAKAYLKETIGSVPGEIMQQGNAIVLVPTEAVQLPDALKTLRFGTAIGTFERGKFQPHHHFFSAFGNLFVEKIELASDDPQATAYLHGEELGTALPDDHAAVMIDGCAAGGVRVRKCRAKNLYPKGLRR